MNGKKFFFLFCLRNVNSNGGDPFKNNVLVKVLSQGRRKGRRIAFQCQDVSENAKSPPASAKENHSCKNSWRI